MWLEWFNRSWWILKRLIGSCILLRWLPSRHIEMTTKLMTTDARIGKGTNAPFAMIVASLSVLMGLCNAMVCSQDRSHTMLEQQCSNFQVIYHCNHKLSKGVTLSDYSCATNRDQSCGCPQLICNFHHHENHTNPLIFPNCPPKYKGKMQFPTLSPCALH